MSSSNERKITPGVFLHDEAAGDAVDAATCSPACPAGDADHVASDLRKAAEEAGLPPEALPSDFFFSSDVDSELARALRDTFDSMEPVEEQPHAIGNNEIQTLRAAARKAGETDPLKIGVLISGSGTNLQALIDAIKMGELDAEIVLVVSSRPSAAGLKRAAAAGIPTLALSKEIYADPWDADEVIATELKRAGAEYIVMAGYMRKVHEPLLALWPDRVVNIHPALLPSFQGAHGIQDAYDRGVKVTGVTVHFANAVYDQGPIIAQEPVRIEEGWTVEELEAAIHEVEHRLYPHVIQLLAEGRVSVTPDRTVRILPE